MNRIRGSILELVNQDEITEFIKEGLVKDESEVLSFKQKAYLILRHICDICSERCKRRKGTDNNNLVCRYENVGFKNETPYKHVFQNIYIQHSKNAMEILKKLGLYVVDPKSNSLIATNDILIATKHYPCAYASEGKISSCNGRLFLATVSSQNLKYVTGYLTSRYLTRYLTSCDEHNRIFINA